MAKKAAVYVPLKPHQQKLVRDNLRFVYKIVNEFKLRGHTEDLIAEGNLGLCIAASRFDPSRNVRFTTYSAHWIRAMVFQYLLRTQGQMRIRAGIDRRVFFGLFKAYAAIGGPEQDDHEAVAKYLKTDVETVALMLRRFNYNGDQVIGKTDSNGRPFDLVDRKPLVEDVVIEHEDRETVKARVRQALGFLTPRERRIIEGRLMADEPKTLDAIGREFGVGREWIRQLEVRATGKMKRLLEVPTQASRLG